MATKAVLPPVETVPTTEETPMPEPVNPNAGRFVETLYTDELPESNAVRCEDCGTLTLIGADEPTICPDDEGHDAEGVYVTKTALGYEDDAAYYSRGYRGREQFEYPAKDRF